MDIVEIEGKPEAKKGKWSGSKSWMRCRSCRQDRVEPLTRSPGHCECGGEMEELLQPVIQNGKLTSAGRQSVNDFKGNREYIRDQVNKIPPWEGKKGFSLQGWPEQRTPTPPY
jgi:hypothetical protein